MNNKFLKIIAILLLFSATLNAKENSCEEWKRLESKQNTIERELYSMDDGYLKEFRIWQKNFLIDYFKKHKKEVSKCRTSRLFQKKDKA